MKRRTARILTVLAVLVIGLGVVYAVAVAISAARLRDAYAAIEKAGRPMNPGAVIPPTVLDTENAMPLYQSAALLLKAQPAPLKQSDQKEKDLLDYLGKLSGSLADGSIDPNGLAELQELLQRDAVSQALAIIRQGTERAACRFERDYANGLQTYPPLLDFPALSQVLGAKARLEARAGRPAAAWELAQIQLKFTDALRQEPSFICQLLRFRMVELSYETIQEICRTAPPDRQQSEKIVDFLATLDGIEPLMLALDGERLLIGERLFTMPKTQLRETLRREVLTEEPMSDLFYWGLYHRITFRPSFLADHAAYLRTMHQAAAMFERPYSPADRKEPDFGKRHLTNMLVPAVWRIREIHLEMVAKVRMTIAGLGVIQYKQDHATFPQTLDVLEVKNLGDPFDDQPLRYRVEPEGFLLYSIGGDQKDNHGVPRQPKARPRQKEDFDLVWRFAAS
jgi:hypothetical protein